MNGKCDKTGCSNDAKYHPSLLLFAPYKYNCNDPIRTILSLEICEDHKISASLDDFLSNEGWIQLCEMISKAGRVIPERKRTKLTWELIGSFNSMIEERQNV